MVCIVQLVLMNSDDAINIYKFYTGLVDYLIDIDQRNTFFWCLNPNSGDTGGLLQSDWTTEGINASSLFPPFIKQYFICYN